MNDQHFVGASSRERFAELKRSLRKDSWALLAGAGISAAAGVPTWKQLVIESSARFNVPIDEHIAPGVYPDVLEECKRSATSDQEFLDFVAERLCHEVKPAEIHHLLVQLPFEVFATINLDCLLLRAHSEKSEHKEDQSSWAAYPLLTSGDIGRGRVAFLHGRCNCEGDPAGGLEPGKEVLTKSDYAEAYSGETSTLPLALQHLFVSFRVLFLGTSLDDPRILEILRWRERLVEAVERKGGKLPGPHYLLTHTPDPEGMLGAADYRSPAKAVGIEPILYLDRKGDEHFRFVELLRDLVETVPSPEIATAVVEGGPPNEAG